MDEPCGLLIPWSIGHWNLPNICVNQSNIPTLALSSLRMGSFFLGYLYSNLLQMPIIYVCSFLVFVPIYLHDGTHASLLLSSCVSAPSAFIETLRERMFKPSLSSIISESNKYEKLVRFILVARGT